MLQQESWIAKENLTEDISSIEKNCEGSISQDILYTGSLNSIKFRLRNSALSDFCCNFKINMGQIQVSVDRTLSSVETTTNVISVFSPPYLHTGYLLAKQALYNYIKNRWIHHLTGFQHLYQRVENKINENVPPYISSFPGGSDTKEPACNMGDLGSSPGLGRSPGKGHGNPLQYFCLETLMDRGA